MTSHFVNKLTKNHLTAMFFYNDATIDAAKNTAHANIAIIFMTFMLFLHFIFFLKYIINTIKSQALFV